MPLAIVGYVAFTYLHAVPTSGNDLFLVVGCAGVGAALGCLSGKFTSVYTDGPGDPIAKTGLIAAGLWILGTGTRLAFQLFATHGGGAAIQHFSVAHSITSGTAWTGALILMALSEAVCRTSILGWRASMLRRTSVSPVSPPSPLVGVSGTMMGRGERAY